MADFSEEFITWIKTQSSVTALIGTTTACRCFPDQLKQGATLPAMVFYEGGGESIQYMAGMAGLCQSVIHTLSYGATRAAANNLDDKIRVALGAGTMTMGSTFVTEVHCSAHRDTGTDGVDGGTDAYRYWTHRVYDIWHVEPTS